MRDPIRTVTETMICPSIEARAEAATQGGDQAAHNQFQATWPCLTNIEARRPKVDLPVPSDLTIAAWNIERCKRVEDSAALIRASGADIVLATEMDLGMARSGQRHTTRDLADLLGFGYVFGTEFVELGTGDSYETPLFADLANQGGLHGNAILSRYPLRSPALIPIADEGMWFVGQPKNDGQLRIGGRMAMAAQIEAPNGPLTLASVHFESESDAEGRAAQSERLIASLDALYGRARCVIGGDLNTKALSDQELTAQQCLFAPEDAEPSFARFAAAGYDWRLTNTGAPTTRAAPGKPVSYPLSVLDWLFTRNVAAAQPKVIPALSSHGHYLSDHEMITTRITL
ncbi:endonuclease/exonuclease/phosphatase family protein [Epibacterium sp. SM1979]|uniref:Endonuclease/exonuclease/phosphatase family protein n=1 Tax=Tritonibacter litoralis TaxID=2662264 RepID=A0A843YDZ6_9RHOB|nr:endonuclease/exonuclease/phosphatase family protein [Tritonibacter litoralis]MQQ07532.1 endonuclease/exonuclease/phosphatase family protein [Tritonibacter litoralis]